MIILCAWCERDGTNIPIDHRSSGHRDLVSHGICAAHAALTRDRLRQSETDPPKRQDPRTS